MQLPKNIIHIHLPCCKCYTENLIISVMDEEEKLISVTECSRMKGVTRAAIHNAIYRGRIPAVRVGNGWVIKQGDCKAYTPEPFKEAGARGGTKRWEKARRKDTP